MVIKSMQCEQYKIGSIGIDVNHEYYSRLDNCTAANCWKVSRRGGGALLDSINEICTWLLFL